MTSRYLTALSMTIFYDALRVQSAVSNT